MKPPAIALLLSVITSTFVAAPNWLLPSFAVPRLTTSPPIKSVPLSQLKAERNSAKLQYQRYQQLYQAGAISRQALAEAEAQYQIAEATYRLALKQKIPATKLTPAMLRERRAAELAVATAQLNLAELRYQRLVALYQRGAVSKLQLEQSKADLAAAKAAHAAAIANSRNDSPKKQP